MAFVQFSKVSLAFGDRDILKDVSVNLSAGTRAALTGANGSGKSTVLALICCAFHNNSAFTPLSKVRQKTNYYTYSDFFFFAAEERGPLTELKIKNNYLTSVVPRHPKIQGLDIRKKKPSGKWNDYNTRPERVVSYLGINRIFWSR